MTTKQTVRHIMKFVLAFAVPIEALGYWAHSDKSYVESLKIIWRDL